MKTKLLMLVLVSLATVCKTTEMPCDVKNGGCNQKCVNVNSTNHRCECRKGFEFVSNSTTYCQDIDECMSVGSCSQLCTNLEGDYSCHCSEGYTLVRRKHCRASGSSTELLVSRSFNIGWIDIENRTKGSDFIRLIARKNVGLAAVFLDYDIRGNKFYWTALKQIRSVDFNDTEKIIVIANTTGSEGIAVDWIHKHLYWTDNKLKQIVVSSLDGQMKRALITSNLDQPRSIVVVPKTGYMYWTDWGKNPRIEKCGLDGTMRKSIVQTEIKWPNSITADLVDERLYWVDAGLDYIATVDFDGGDRRVVAQLSAHPFGIDIFEDFLYWSDWTTRSVYRMSKSGGEPVVIFSTKPRLLRGLRVFHESRQPLSKNKCGTDNGGCSHLCLPSPENNDGREYSCVCSDKFSLSNDEKTCVESDDSGKLLLSNTDNIGLVHIENGTQLNNFEILLEKKDVSLAVFLDYDIRENKFYWTDMARDQILSVDFNDTKNIMVIAENISSVGIAVDWIHKHLYWTDKDLQQIAVSTLDGQMRSALITTDVDNPRAIVVEPNSGYMYWTDLGKNPRIEKCGLDGTLRKVIVQTDIASPNGLALDFVTERLYWVDAQLDYIASVDFDGGNRRTVYQDQSRSHSFGITIFGDFLYWTDWKTFSVYKYSKYGGDVPLVVFTSLRQPKGIQAIHESRQPLSKNECGIDNGGCSDLCLPSPMMNKGRKYRCVCRDNFTLSYDEKSCVESDFERNVLTDLNTVIENQKEGLVLLRELVNKDGDGRVLNKTITNTTGTLIENPKQNTHEPCDGNCWTNGDSAKLLICNISNIGWISIMNETKTNNFELVIEKGRAVLLDYDMRDNKLYWTNPFRDQILSVDFNDTKNIMVMAENIGSIGIAVDWIHKHLYWTDQDLRQIVVSTLDGQMRRTLITKDVGKPRAIVVEPNSGYMYWTDWGKNPRIEKCGLDGTMREIIVQNDMEWPNGITVDFDEERLYWVEARLDYIASVDYDGGNRRTVYQSPSNFHPLGITMFGDNIYWTDWMTTSVYKMNKYGSSEPVAVFSNLREPMGVQIIHESRQPLSKNKCGTDNGGCSDFCLPSPITNNGRQYSCVCRDNFTLSYDEMSCVAPVVDKPCDGNCWSKGDGAKLLISNISNIGWISIMNETKTNKFELFIETDHAVLVDYDMRDNKLYWTNPLRDQILSFDFNDTKNIMVIAENIDSIGIAVDWIHKHLYWTDQDLRQIAVSTLDGQMRRTLITKDVGKPRAIVVEPNSGYMYWTDWGKNPRIEKCGLDGTMREIIVQNDMEWPNGITVDFDEERLFWVEARLDYIASVDYDGGNRRTVYQAPYNTHPLGITMFGDNIYWTDWITDSVYKMNKYGSSEPVAVFSNLREPMGVQIIHESRQPLSKNKCGTDNGGCSDFCLPSPITNNGRQYSCVCRDNFTLSYDEMSCVAPVVDKPCDGNCWSKGDGAKLLISNISNIGWISIMNETKTNKFELFIETDHAVLVDYDMRDNKLYWTNPLRDQILSFDFNDTKNIMVIAENIDSIGIAVDWIHKHLYWTDQDLRQIAVSTLDGQMRRTLITKDVGKPRAIVVEPNSGYIYWTDWGKNPRIEKCGLDGTMREIIVQNDMEWPNGITVDFDEERLFWVEARLDYIASVDYDGGNRRTVYRAPYNTHPLGITMFGDNIYWTDWITDSVYKMNKYGSSEPVAVFSNLREPMGVQIIHESRQSLSKNKCGTDNGGCSDFCLPSPITNNGRQYSCVCRDNFTLSYDEMSCVAPGAIETSRKPSTTARTTPIVTIAPSKREDSFEKEVLLDLKTVKENQKESLILLRELVNEQDGGNVLDKTIIDKADLLLENNQDGN